MDNKDVEFWIEPILEDNTVYYDGKYYKELIGYIRYINVDIYMIHKITFITNDNPNGYNYESEIKILKHPKHHDCLYFRINAIHAILKQYNVQDKQFSIRIELDGKTLLSDSITILYK